MGVQRHGRHARHNPRQWMMQPSSWLVLSDDKFESFDESEDHFNDRMCRFLRHKALVGKRGILPPNRGVGTREQRKRKDVYFNDPPKPLAAERYGPCPNRRWERRQPPSNVTKTMK